MPFGAYGPVRYDSTGKNCSLAWACAAPLTATEAAVASAAHSRPALALRFISIPPPEKRPSMIAPSVRERPEPQLLLADRPQAGQPVRLQDQENHDQGAENHEFHVRGGGGRDRDP